MKAYVVGNPRGKKKKKAPAAKPKVRKRKVNPLEMLITGAGVNPHRKRRNKMAAKKKSNKARAHNPHHKGQFQKKQNRHRRANRFRNPILPVEARRLPGLLLGGAVGGVASVWLPNLLMAGSDVGFFGYLMNTVTAVLGAWALSAMGMTNAALGFLIGGGVAVIGRVIDDVTGKQVIQFSAPMSGMGQFYRQNRVTMPTLTQTDLTDVRRQAMAQGMLAPAPGSGTAIPVSGSVPLHTASPSAANRQKTMGWYRGRVA